MVRVYDLEFSYGKDKVLNQATVDVSKGELISIVGPNGTGKSTLIRCINGLLKAQKGQIKISQIDIKTLSRPQIAKKVSYVPQNSSNIFDLKVFDMVMFGRRPHSSFRIKREDRVKALKAMNILHIEHLAMRNFNHLSGGQQQKVIIARALAQETGVILLDEPISNLDIRHQLEVMDTLRALVDKAGITVLMVVHDLNIAAQYSDRIVMMDRGKIVAAGKPEEVITKESVASIYGVDAEITMISNKPHIIPLNVRYD